MKRQYCWSAPWFIEDIQHKVNNAFHALYPMLARGNLLKSCCTIWCLGPPKHRPLQRGGTVQSDELSAENNNECPMVYKQPAFGPVRTWLSKPLTYSSINQAALQPNDCWISAIFPYRYLHSQISSLRFFCHLGPIIIATRLHLFRLLQIRSMLDL